MFEWEVDCIIPQFQVNCYLSPKYVQALKDVTINRGVPKLFLDGGWPEKYGVAPNDHLFEWFFGW